MRTLSIQKKRKNIDLPTDTLQKLSFLALSQGKSLKAYIESILISKANSINIVVSVSPSNDTWFDDPENLDSIKRGLEDVANGRTKTYSMDDLSKMLDS